VNNPRLLKRLGLSLEGTPEVHSGILPSVAYDDKLVFGKVVRVGDSANFATPTLGEGIRVCIEFGRLLGEDLGRAIKTGSQRPLKHYERQCRRRLKRDYRWGFLVNTRVARFGPAQWDASVRRMRNVDPEAFVALMRGEFPRSKIAKMIWASLRGRLRRMFTRPPPQ